MLDEKDALIAKEKEVVAVKPVVAAVPAVDKDALLVVDKDDDRRLESAVGLDEVELVGVKRKLRELQKTCRAKRRRVPTPVAEALALANELLGSVEAYTILAGRAAYPNFGEKPEVGLENMMVERCGNCKAFLTRSWMRSKKLTPVSWIRFVVCSRRANASCSKSVTSGSWSKSSYAVSAIEVLSLPRCVTICFPSGTFQYFRRE